jgi:NAD(P)-dependent dehydrogenase (short-subunit alcohol dehydrogenase family)
MSYELEPFGIRVFIIEPGVIRTNIMNSSVLAKKALDPKSPYSSLMQKVENSFESMLKNAASPPEEVAKVILQAISSESPLLRYTAGNDADDIIRAKTTMSEAEFANSIKQQFLSQ